MSNLKYRDEVILSKLDKMTLEEIQDAKERYKKRHNRSCLEYLFNVAIDRKMDDADRIDLLNILDEVTNAPDSATNTTKGE